MKNITLGTIYPMPKHYGVSIRLNKLTANLNSNIKNIEIVQKKWSESLVGKLFYLLKQILLVSDKNFNPEIIYSAAPLVTGAIPGLFAKKIKKRPLIMDWDDSFEDFRIKKPRIWQASYWEYQSILNADAVIVVSHNLRDIAQHIRGSERNIYYVPNGVDTQQFNPKKHEIGGLRKKLGIKNNEIVICFLGHIGKSKIKFVGYEFAVICKKLLYKNKQLKILVIGYGKTLPKFKEYVEKNQISNHFIFTGFLSQKDIPSYLAISDICVDALPNNFELTINLFNRSSMKIKEYMAMAKPTIVLGVGENIYDTDNGRAGILVKTHKGLEIALKKLINSSRLRKNLGNRARKYMISMYDLKKQIKMLEEIIKTHVVKS